MTGFGNSSFFYVKWDFSLVHVLQMFWRKTMPMAFLCFIRTRRRGAGGDRQFHCKGSDNSLHARA